ncbi:MAG: glycoside hydrolase family 5 protein [Clostridiaceae bacterium]|nr:glycoside hydrolase family 5 protein [Clostridiaceae bacterium]
MKLIKGINLGGYLSQCRHSNEHYEGFIRESDIKQIRDWGFDHVRLPIDYEVLETEDGMMKTEGYGYVSQAISWCEKYDLNIVLDLHKAYGYDFNDAGDKARNNLFTNEELKQRFIKLWTNIANEYGKYSNVAFELLNEVVEEENAEAWNELIRRTVPVIRSITKETPIIYGGIQWNSAGTLKYLEIPEDDNIIFTFHFYEPLVFTHQKAHWMEKMDKSAEMDYPDSMENHRMRSAALGYQGGAVCSAKSETMGPGFMREMMAEAVEAAKNAGVGLYCGEFGVIDQAPAEGTLRWFRDVFKVFRELDIGWAIWTYKEKDFGLIDSHYDSIREGIIRAGLGS